MAPETSGRPHVEERVRSATDEDLERYAERVVLVGRLEQVFAD